MSVHLQHEKIWIDKPMYDKAEKQYYENLAKAQLTPLAEEVAKARQRLIEIKHSYNNDGDDKTNKTTEMFNQKIQFMQDVMTYLQATIKSFEVRLAQLEQHIHGQPTTTQTTSTSTTPMAMDTTPTVKKQEEDDDDVDLFGSDSEDEDAAAAKVREERLAAYNEKKSKKPTLIAKSSILLDVKPWDDDTDMKALEAAVRTIQSDGLLWGASKLVPLAYGIHKLQILCVIEDEKIALDWLQDKIQEFEDLVQSVDIAAFNKI